IAAWVPALLLPRAAAALACVLARLPATRQEVLSRLRAYRLAARVVVDRLPRAVLLGVAVPRVDLDQTLALGVVLLALELLVERRAGRGVEAPGRAVRNHECLTAPLRKLLEELFGRRGALLAIGRPRGVADTVRTLLLVVELALVLAEVEVALAARHLEKQELELLPERHFLTEKGERPPRRADRAARDLVLVGLAEDHVLVPVVRLRGR